MAFDRDGFSHWLRTVENLPTAAKHYPLYLDNIEAQYHWNVDSILPAGFIAADAQLTADIKALNPLTDGKLIHRLSNWRSGFRKYHTYLTNPG